MLQLKVGLRKLEVAGHMVWQKIQPLAVQHKSIQTSGQAFVVGALWGWLPCGLVYSTLTWSLASGVPWQGALIMFSFGIGTLPGLLLMGEAAYKFKSFMQQKTVQYFGALAMICFGCHTLWVGIREWVS